MLNNWAEPEARRERIWPENPPALRKIGIAVEGIASRLCVSQSAIRRSGSRFS